MARTSSTGATPARSGSGKGADTPPKTRWYKQVWQVYQMTRETDPATTWWMLGSFLGILAVGVVVGLVTHRVWYFVLMAVPIALIVAMLLLTRRAESAAYRRIEGQPMPFVMLATVIACGWGLLSGRVALDLAAMLVGA